MMGYPSKSLVEQGQELHEKGAELWAVLVDAFYPVLAATLAGLVVLLKKLGRR